MGGHNVVTALADSGHIDLDNPEATDSVAFDVVPIIPACTITNVAWSTDTAFEGEIVDLRILLQ